MKSQIESESGFILRFVWQILLTPIIIIEAIFGKKRFGEIFNPFKTLFGFLFEPVFTVTIIAINIIVYFVVLFLNLDISSFVASPSIFTTGNYIALLTAGFLHADLNHLFGNMVMIYLLGRVVERQVGSFKTGMIYFVALILASFSDVGVNYLMGNNISGLGASGALMGLAAAAALLDPFYLTYELLIPIPVMLLSWFSLYLDISGLLSGANDNIGHVAHLGGFTAITLVLYFFERENSDKVNKGLWINIIALFLSIGLYYYLLG